MLKQMNDQIYRLTLPHYRDTVHSYLIKGAKGFTVMDTGPNLEEARSAWQKLIADGLSIEKVIISHGHADHIGLAAWFQQELKVPVIFSGIGYDEMKEIRRKSRDAAAGGDRPAVFVLQHGGPAIPETKFYEHQLNADFEPDEVYEPGSFLTIGDMRFQAIWTPGHARDQFCFWNEEKRILFSSDHVLDNVSPVIPTWSEQDVNPLQDYFDSLQALKPYEPHLVLPGHGEPIPDLHVRIEELRLGHIHRLEQISDILKKGEQTAAQIALEIYGGDLRGFMVLLVLSSTVSRLNYLRGTGRVVSRVKDDGKIYYALI
jgi:glyoxylase-like metal-dependent hydrolase (beta-lactamase superfamily II)